MPSHHLAAELETLGVVIAQETYLKPQAAIEALALCKDANTAIVGVEGFLLQGNSVKPRMDLIADWSDLESSDWPAFVEQTHTLTKRFLSEINDDSDIVVNLTLLDRED